MAVTRIKSYHSKAAITNGLRYISNPDKVRLTEPSAAESDAPLQNVLNYSINPVKTLLHEESGEELMVFGHNCIPEEAEALFADLRQRYLQSGHKETVVSARARRPMRAALDKDGHVIRNKGGELIYDPKAPVYHDPNTGRVIYQQYMKQKEAITAYSWVMSFPPDKILGYELDPHLVNQIGKAFCQNYLDDYAVVYAQHLDRPHKHLHFVQCAYALDGTHKYHDNMTTLARAREISDQLSIQFGLPIIVHPGMDQSVSWYELQQRQNGTSWKESFRRDIRQALELATDEKDFVSLMEAAGYTIRQTAHHYTFTRHHDDPQKPDLRCRDSKLNTAGDLVDYTRDGITEAIRQRVREREKVISDIQTKKKDPVRIPYHIVLSRYTIDGRRRTDLELVFVEALKLISLLMDEFQMKTPPSDHPVYRPAAWKLKEMEESIRIVQEYGIEDKEGLKQLIAQTGMSISILKKESTNANEIAERASDVIAMINEAADKMSLLSSVGMKVSDLELYAYSPREIRQGRANLMPMTPAMRRELYLKLSDSPIYRVRCKYEELTWQEARQILDFLSGRTKDKPDVLYDLSDPFTKGYLPREKGEGGAEQDSVRKAQDDRFMGQISNLELEDMMDIDRLRTLLNKLAQAGISPEGMEDAKKELSQTVQHAAEVEQRLQEAGKKYHTLMHLSENLALAENRQFTRGPLYDEKKAPAVTREFTETEIPERTPQSRDNLSVTRS